MKRIWTFVFIGCLTILASGQEPGLTIGPADMLHVKVLEAPELEQTGRVTDSGDLQLILGGSVKVLGLTPAEAGKVIERALVGGNYVLSPHVSVTIEQYATQNVSILGQVKNPGSFPVGTPRSVIDVLALAGGLTDLADRNITIQRHDSKQRVEFLLSNHSRTALDQSVLVYPGDTILVPRADVVYILGDVNRPGGITIATNDSRLSVLQAISLAGGTPPTAVPSHARLIRKVEEGKYVELNLPLSAMQKGRRADMPLQADDIIYVPFSYLRNMGMGIDSLLAAAGSAAVFRF